MQVINAKNPNTKLPVPPRRTLTDLASKIGPKDAVEVEALINGGVPLTKPEIKAHEARGAEHAKIEGRLRAEHAAIKAAKAPGEPAGKTSAPKATKTATPAKPAPATVQSPVSPPPKPGVDHTDNGKGVPTFLVVDKAEAEKRAEDRKRTPATTITVPMAKPLSNAELEAKRVALGLDKNGRPAKKAKPGKVSKPAKPASDSKRYPWADAEEAAARGVIPKRLDFSADHHKRWVPLLKEVETAVTARDVKAIKAVKIVGDSSSRNAIRRWQELCVTALTAKK